jgi:sugar lactone lactonase YvrE
VLPGTATLAVDARCTLGEGIVWSASRRALFWTDIQASTLWMHEVDANVTRTWTLPDRLGSLVLCESGRLVLGLAKGLFIADIDAAAGPALSATPVVDVEPGLAGLRINDGRTDRSGNYVFGTMHEPEPRSPAGGFYQFSARHGLRRLNLDPISIANSICFSLDGARMYFCDSPTARIMHGDYDPASARVSNIREFARLTDGQPDGSVIDEGGCLWNAVWGAGLIRRYSPDGSVDREIAVPAKNPTCPGFAGDALDRLYITSSRQEMTDEELDRVPHAGGVYVVTPGVRGVADAVLIGL